MRNFSELYRLLDYRFTDEDLLITALSHRSAGKRNYERLEFLGDAIIGFLIADALCTAFPQASEGELSRFRAELVQQATLAQLARQLRLGQALILGKGERKDGGAERDSILSDAFEAVVSALYLDAGLDACRQLILPLFEPAIKALVSGEAPKDAKTRLQEALQARRMALPQYSVIATEGQDHDQNFHVSCRLEALSIVTRGMGSNRKEAEQEAAGLALVAMENSA